MTFTGMWLGAIALTASVACAWEFQVLETRGSAYERGVQHGQKFREEIQRDFNEKGGWAWSINPLHRQPGVLRHLLDRMLQWPNGRELIDEMQGIADGCGRSFEEIAALNLTFDLSERTACSMVLIPGAKGGPLLVGTLDDFPGGKHRQNYPLFIQVVYPSEGHAMVILCNYGTVWAHGGLNDTGLAMASTSGGLGAPRGGANYDGVYYGLLSRYALQFHDRAQQSIDLYTANLHISKGINISVLDRAGDGAVFEFSASAIGVRRVKDRQPLRATNFFQTEKYPPYSADIEKYPYQINARARYARLGELLANGGAIDVSAAQRIVTDANDGREGQICQDNKVMYTVLGHVFDCARATAHYYPGHPGATKPVVVAFDASKKPAAAKPAPANERVQAVLTAEPLKPGVTYHRLPGSRIVAIESEGSIVTIECEGKRYRADLRGSQVNVCRPIRLEEIPADSRVDLVEGQKSADGTAYLARRIESHDPPLPWKEQSVTSTVRQQDGQWIAVYGDGRTMKLTLADGCRIFMRTRAHPSDLQVGDAVDVHGSTILPGQDIQASWVLTYPIGRQANK
jgi:hypothetical protein